MTKIALILSLLCAAVTPARAADAPRPDPKGRWHVTTTDDATTTSKCIGKEPNSTPLCAVQNFRACYIRVDNKLCRIAVGDPEFPLNFFSGTPKKYYFERFRVVTARPLRASDMTYIWEESENNKSIREGDFWMVIMYSSCRYPVESGDCSKYESELNYILRRPPEGWHIATWFGAHRARPYRNTPRPR